jgi:hypothetical protein
MTTEDQEINHMQELVKIILSLLRKRCYPLLITLSKSKYYRDALKVSEFNNVTWDYD